MTIQALDVLLAVVASAALDNRNKLLNLLPVPWTNAENK